MKFRKKPVVIEAALYDGNLVGDPMPGDPTKVQMFTCPLWFPAAIAEDDPGMEPMAAGDVRQRGDKIVIATLEGEHTASPGDWIICGVKGELYPCKPDIFAETYEPAT